jgi:LysR family transcriptional regulator, nitrogen assimilation regulatory protein
MGAVDMAFDIRKIEYFLAVIEQGNISSAAEALRVSQPTLSRQIHALERQFNTPLFIRHGRGVSPTEAGKRLQEGLRGLEHHLRTLRDDVAAAARDPSGEVALGIPPSPRMLLAGPIVSTFCKAYPQVAVRIIEQTSSDIRDLVARGEVDLAVINSDEPMQGLACDRLATEPMLLIGPRHAKLSLDAATPIKRLAELPLILTTRPNSLRRIVELELNRRGLRPRIRVEANTLPLMTDLVALGLGFTVLPSCGVLSLVKAGRFSASPLTGLRLTWTIARPANRNPSVAARLLLDIVFRTVRNMVETDAWPLAELERDCKHALRRTAATKVRTAPNIVPARASSGATNFAV